MAEVALTALEWVASPIIEKLMDKVVTFLGTDLAEELDDLKTTIFPQFELVIKAAESSPAKPKVEDWLRRLKNAYYETEDILDELEYQRLESEVKAKSACKEGPRKAMTSKGACSYCFLKPLKKLRNKVNKKFSLLSPTQIKLRNQLKNLREVAEESKRLCEILNIQPQAPTSSKGPASSGSIPLNTVLGRDRDRDRIIDLLVGESNPPIAITGMGGAGKTTLAQFIFNDTRVKNHFDVRIWVCLSPKLDVIKHTKEMVESASLTSVQLESIDAVQRKLTDILVNSKNTLLVLDDIWYNGQTEEEEWSQFLAPFTSRVGEHRILLTSRKINLPTALGSIKHSSFKELEANDFKALFRYFAFGGDNSRQFGGDNSRLEEIGDKIAEKLSRSPLAAKAVASRLSRNLDYVFWNNTLDKVDLSDISKSLLWTYQRLDAELQRCFSYCSIFPKGWRFTEFHLVGLWVCENFIKCSDDTNNVTEKAKDYFNELIACSFFQPVTDNPGGVSYKIHDLFHDLAEKLSKEDCFRVQGSTQIEIPSTVRHISISVSDLKEHIPIILKSDQVRTVIFLEPFVNDVNGIFRELLCKLKKLRVLVLKFFDDTMLPELVGELKHLRHLEIYHSSISELPESLSELYHLQVLLLNESVKKLPKNLSNLMKLQQLLMFDTFGNCVATLPPIANIGNLTLLETVVEFRVRKENGFELCQLGNLKRIKGFFCIKDLENGNKVHANEAKLCDKKDIERLALVWSNCEELRNDLEVIEALQPHENLKHLLLENYSAAKYPNWLLEKSVIRNLYSITLYDCRYLEVLPSNLTYCNELALFRLYNLRDLSHLPERLKRIEIAYCPALVFAPKEELQLSNHDLNLNEEKFLAYWLDIMIEIATRLDWATCLANEYVMLKKSPLSQNNEYSQYLETIRGGAEGEQPLDENAMQAWWHCHQQRINFVYRENANAPEFTLPSSLTKLTLIGCNIADGALSYCLTRLTALSELHLRSIMTLTTLPSERIMRQLKSLKTLTIVHCWCLRSLGFLQGLVSLEILVVAFCPCLEINDKRAGTTFPTSLQSLNLGRCVIPDGMFTCNMPYLYELKVLGCRGSRSLPIGMLTSLRNIILWACPDLCRVEGLQSLPCLNDLVLINLSSFQAGSLLDTPVGLGWRTLQISSLEMLKALSSNNAFAYVKRLVISECQEETFTFEELSHIPSLELLTFVDCKIKVLPNSLKDLSGLKFLEFINCPEIFSMPELPDSIVVITIEKCPVLKERCRSADGPDWPKIARIPYKIFKD